jgi:recombination protein RecA
MPTAKLTKLVTDLKDKFGDDSVMFATDIPLQAPISSGSLALDFAIGHGVFPADRVIELDGEEGCGKTTLSLLATTRFLDAQPDRGALIMDLEHKLSPDWVRTLVGDERMDRLIYVQPDHIEQATNIYRQAVTSGQVCIAVLDSIGGSPTIRRNDDATVASYGGNSLGVGEFARTAAALSSKYRCLTIGVNQTRADMEGYHRMNTPGGKAWKHAVILRIQLKKSNRETVEQTINGEKITIGQAVYAKVVKNQLSTPGRTAMWWFFNVATEEYGFGVDVLDEVVRLGILTKVIHQTGGWYTHPALPADKKGDHKINGLASLKKLIYADRALKETLVSEILTRLDAHASEVAPISDPDAPIEEAMA